jgi:basic membrane protein A
MGVKSWISQWLALLVALTVLAGCARATPVAVAKQKVGILIDAGSEDDRAFNQSTLQGVREAAESAGLDFVMQTPQSASDYERALLALVSTEQPDLVVTVGFRMGDATAKVARKNPAIRFVIIDNAYLPGAGCAETVTDCYQEGGGLSNVTSLMFAEDQIGYLAGVLAACMSLNNVIASVAGLEIPPVERFVQGFQNGARSVKPNIVTLNQYIPDFNDPDTGKVVAQSFIRDRADVIFGVAGKTGNGALLAAHEASLKAIGVDVDQYYTYPEVRDSLLTSAMKNVDIAAASAVRDFAAGTLQSGIRLSTLENGGIGLAPYHDWEGRIYTNCKEEVNVAQAALIKDPSLTGIP